MKQFQALLAAAAAAAIIGLGTSSQAATLANFSQNPADGGMSATGGMLSIASVPIDYNFQVPPSFPTTTPAYLTVWTDSPIVMSTVSSGKYEAVGSVLLHFTVLSVAGSVNLLSGDLIADDFLANNNTKTIIFSGSGVSWTSVPTYDVGGGAKTADLLSGYAFSMSLVNLKSISLDGSSQLVFTSNNGSPGGSSITGNFSAVPEPASLVLMGLGLAGIPGVVALRKRAARA